MKELEKLLKQDLENGSLDKRDVSSIKFFSNYDTSKELILLYRDYLIELNNRGYESEEQINKYKYVVKSDFDSEPYWYDNDLNRAIKFIKIFKRMDFLNCIGIDDSTIEEVEESVAKETYYIVDYDEDEPIIYVD